MPCTRNDRVGGLVGNNAGGTSTISNSYAAGAVEGTTSVGGLVGENDGGTIENSYATGAVEGTGANIGGLVGKGNYGTIQSSYAAGAVGGTGADRGGLVGGDVSSSAMIDGTNYFVDADGAPNGIGGAGVCVGTCTQVAGLQTIFDALFDTTQMDWLTSEWQNRGNAHPCIVAITFGRGGCPP